MTVSSAGDGARDAYDAFASAYDDFNRAYMNERWTARLLAKAEEAGLRGNRLLDIGCGTGLSFTPMLERGWRVTGCDISPQMLELARAKAGEEVELAVADMSALPVLGEFDLVWALNDSVNYLLAVEQLESTLAGMGRNLAPGGIALFDLNTITAYRSFFSEDCVVEVDGRRLVWRGQMSGDELEPGAISEARFEAEGEGGEVGIHRQRHFPEAEVLAAIEAAGLRSVAVFGERDGDLEPALEEEVHTKGVYLVAFDT